MHLSDQRKMVLTLTFALSGKQKFNLRPELYLKATLSPHLMKRTENAPHKHFGYDQFSEKGLSKGTNINLATQNAHR